MGERDNDGNRPRHADDPPNSRLFIVCAKTITEEEFRKAFDKYGFIEEVWIVKDKGTGDPKGIVYIKFSKTSEAARAMEEMNGAYLMGHARGLKVMVAHNREQGSKREENESERLMRLFIMCSKAQKESDLREHFKKFGDLEYVTIVKDRETKESKGFAYVKYYKASHAARAFEECDRCFKAVFARPRESKQFPQGSQYDYERFPTPYVEPYYGGAVLSGAGDVISKFPNPECYTRLIAVVSSLLSQEHVGRLFDIIPGLELCHFVGEQPYSRMHNNRVLVRYGTPQSAAYARDKIHGMEYPPGHRILIKPDLDSPHNARFGSAVSLPVPGKRDARGQALLQVGLSGDKGKDEVAANLAQLKKALSQATKALSAAGIAVPPLPGEGAAGDALDPSFCSVKLPSPQPLARKESKTAERLFIVCQPGLPPMYALRDVFGRFGDLIEVYMLSGKNCGYVSYATKDAADKAIETLHLEEVCGMRLKVMLAEPPKAESRKRFKMDENNENNDSAN